MPTTSPIPTALPFLNSYFDLPDAFAGSYYQAVFLKRGSQGLHCNTPLSMDSFTERAGYKVFELLILSRGTSKTPPDSLLTLCVVLLV